MESSLSSIQALVSQIKQEILSNFNPSLFISPSAYDTAWLALVPCPNSPRSPLFKGCLNWVLKSQKEEGFWGGVGGDGLPAIDSLPATLACLIAIKKWGVGEQNLKKGLAFINSYSEMLFKVKDDKFPRWFAIVFPAMVELALENGLEIVFPKGLEAVLSNISLERQRILQTEELVDNYQFAPLLAYLEALPFSCPVHEEDIERNLSEDGSLFQSPSATARAFLATGNLKCLDYLKTLVAKHPNGVPAMYPIDEELVSLCMVNQVQRLGLAEHFTKEIGEILEQIYRSYKEQEKEATTFNLAITKIYKDSLAFRLLRMHGYNVTSRSFCWFLYHEEIVAHMERNYEYFTSVLYNVYRATDLMFSGEGELEEARLFSRKLLEKSLKLTNINDNMIMFANFQKILSIPWIARLDHLDHRMWIEENQVDTLWIAKATFYRISCLQNHKLMQLAVENFEFRQSIYRKELEELNRWSKDLGLSEMGFGREKTTYCYYAVACSTSVPHDSVARLIVAKSAILVTVADDFYDMEGSLEELQTLTQAVQRWDGRGLTGHGKVIFLGLDNLVRGVATKWRETFVSWLMETTWSKSEYIPSMEEYLEIGMTSIAVHAIILPASCFLSTSSPSYELKTSPYETITKLLMVSTRLLNDIQSYEKEIEVGRKNLVMLHQIENSRVGIENSISYVRDILNSKKKELLEHALIDDLGDLSKSFRHFHLSCLRVFQMFFNSSNVFDSATDLLHDIKRAIYMPLEYNISKPLNPLKQYPSQPVEKGSYKIQACVIKAINYKSKRSIIRQQFSISSSLRLGCQKVVTPMKPNFRFI
ncbi:Alpha-farnesene synthase [Bertholletia excelsa]